MQAFPRGGEHVSVSLARQNLVSTSGKVAQSDDSVRDKGAGL